MSAAALKPAFSEQQIRAAIRTSLASALSVPEAILDDERDFDAREIDAETIFEHPSVAQLARHLAAAA
ncbi:MAG: hypothetical protein FD124_267 [Alphaproteobacteria bacterium]|nr:MAG: hypothetical protein FD124_267 [Alphaproteobacteria bacterium]